jgi:hypothetical protein
VEVESKLMLASRFDFPSASLASTTSGAKAPLLNTLSISLDLFRDIELCFLTKSSSFWSELLSLAVDVLVKNTAVPRVL